MARAHNVRPYVHKFQAAENTKPITMGGVFLHSVAVLEPVSGKVTGLIRDWLIRQGSGPSVVLTRGTRLEAFSGAYDLFVVASADDDFAGGDVQGIRSRALLTPCSAGAGALAIPSQWVVSYGMAVRDSLTVSSVEPDLAVLALQRELPTLAETVIERQELPLPIPPGMGAQGVMALYGSLLILGVPPEALARDGGILQSTTSS